MEYKTIEKFSETHVNGEIEITFLDGSTMLGYDLKHNNSVLYANENMWLLKRKGQFDYSFYGEHIVSISVNHYYKSKC